MNTHSANSVSFGRLVVLTGASRGLGRALAEQCLKQGVALVTLSRSHVDELDQLACDHNVPLTQLVVDLNDRVAVEQTAKQMAELLSQAQRPRLIQNAGVVTPVTVADQPASFLEIEQAYLTNVVTPTFLTNHFLAATSHATDRRVMLISSGAGRQAIPGWGVYCATKAALDRYAEVVSVEQGTRARIVAVAPGVINTPMQETIRNADSKRFPVLDTFVQLHQQGALAQPAHVAEQLLSFIEDDSFGQKTIDDIRQHEF
jgi:NAD(P)-dependent dehydrogenase (short-subunit alcohol dehydrogenase family)